MDAPPGSKTVLFFFYIASISPHLSSTSPLNATSSLFCSLSHIPHHAFLHPEHHISLDDFLSLLLFVSFCASVLTDFHFFLTLLHIVLLLLSLDLAFCFAILFLCCHVGKHRFEMLCVSWLPCMHASPPVGATVVTLSGLRFYALFFSQLQCVHSRALKRTCK